jgi:hypothetical protein
METHPNGANLSAICKRNHLKILANEFVMLRLDRGIHGPQDWIPYCCSLLEYEKGDVSRMALIK